MLNLTPQGTEKEGNRGRVPIGRRACERKEEGGGEGRKSKSDLRRLWRTARLGDLSAASRPEEGFIWWKEKGPIFTKSCGGSRGGKVPVVVNKRSLRSAILIQLKLERGGNG